MKIKIITSFYLIVTITFFLSACSNETLPENEVKKLYEEKLLASAESEFEKNIFTLTNLTKTEGYHEEEYTYIAIVESKSKANKSLDEIIEFYSQTYDTISLKNIRNMLTLQYGNFKRNDILKAQLKLEFKKSDNGWKLVKVYNNKS
jgi:PBP1b-binding outer membrane lipoprotein LpoB